MIVEMSQTNQISFSMIPKSKGGSTREYWHLFISPYVHKELQPYHYGPVQTVDYTKRSLQGIIGICLFVSVHMELYPSRGKSNLTIVGRSKQLTTQTLL